MRGGPFVGMTGMTFLGVGAVPAVPRKCQERFGIPIQHNP